MHIILDEFDQETAILFPNMNDSKIETELELSLYTISGWKLLYFDDDGIMSTISNMFNNKYFLQMKIKVK